MAYSIRFFNKIVEDSPRKNKSQKETTQPRLILDNLQNVTCAIIGDMHQPLYFHRLSYPTGLDLNMCMFSVNE